MALEAAVYQYQQDLFGHNNNGISDLYPLLLETWACPKVDEDPFIQLDHQNAASYDYLLLENQSEVDWHSYYGNNNEHCDYASASYNNNNNVWDYSTSTCISTPVAANLGTTATTTTTTTSDEFHQWAQNSSSPDDEQQGVDVHGHEYDEYINPVEVTRTKRRRARAKKNKEDIENQRMTHIAVERNRRKQMNDYLNVLRDLMPNSYVQRGDQASIIGGAINFVKELEQNLQCLSAKKHINDNHNDNNGGGSSSSLPFSEFFAFPQYSSNDGGDSGGTSCGVDDEMNNATRQPHVGGGTNGRGGPTADVEVTMVESHALVKIRMKRAPKHLSKLVSGLQCLRLIILHLNVTKIDGVALFSLSVKVEDDSKLNSVDEIAGAVYQLLGRIQEEAAINC